MTDAARTAHIAGLTALLLLLGAAVLAGPTGAGLGASVGAMDTGSAVERTAERPLASEPFGAVFVVDRRGPPT